MNVDRVSLGDITFNHLFLADGLVLVSEAAEGLQNCIDTLSNYCMEWLRKNKSYGLFY